eukprot:COSAG01_NODE_52875_length_343_cov_1.016393_1_plen_31_part_01
MATLVAPPLRQLLLSRACFKQRAALQSGRRR